MATAMLACGGEERGGPATMDAAVESPDATVLDAAAEAMPLDAQPDAIETPDSDSAEGDSGMDASDAAVEPVDAATTDSSNDAGAATTAPRLALGGEHTCLVRADRRVACWGENGDGQLGNNSLIDRSNPTVVSGLSRIVDVSLGTEHSCARHAAGTIWCWGSNRSGRLGHGDAVMIERQPVAAFGVSASLSLSAGDQHTCVALLDGTMRCWGRNVFGQLGTDTSPVMSRSRPVQTDTISAAVEVAAGEEHTCARLDGGDVWCWGKDDLGQLGDAATSPGGERLEPRPVTNLTDAIALDAGREFTCAVRMNGSLWCWGNNRQRQLGAVSGDLHDSPVEVLSARELVEVSVGYHHGCARSAGGEVWCFGDDAFGQLGDGSADSSGGTVQVSFETTVTQVAVGGDHSCAQAPLGTVFCWGRGHKGQLGGGDATDANTPQAVSF